MTWPRRCCCSPDVEHPNPPTHTANPMTDRKTTIEAAREAAAAMNPGQQPPDNRATRRQQQLQEWRRIRRRGRAMAAHQDRTEKRGFGS